MVQLIIISYESEYRHGKNTLENKGGGQMAAAVPLCAAIRRGNQAAEAELRLSQAPAQAAPIQDQARVSEESGLSGYGPEDLRDALQPAVFVQEDRLAVVLPAYYCLHGTQALPQE